SGPPRPAASAVGGPGCLSAFSPIETLMKKETLWVAGIPVALMTLGLPRAALSQPVRALTPVVVTAPAADEPLVVRTDPKAPRQPVPAHDGADFLKSIPGFSVIRKGGTDGDPVLRGFSGSRLGILLD